MRFRNTPQESKYTATVYKVDRCRIRAIRFCKISSHCFLAAPGRWPGHALSRGSSAARPSPAALACGSRPFGCRSLPHCMHRRRNDLQSRFMMAHPYSAPVKATRFAGGLRPTLTVAVGRAHAVGVSAPGRMSLMSHQREWKPRPIESALPPMNGHRSARVACPKCAKDIAVPHSTRRRRGRAASVA